MQIEYLGWRPVRETIKVMAQTDVTYLPYWFDKSRQFFVHLCFPNKLSTYLAAGRPVIYHGPEESSVAKFFQRFPVGPCCYSLEPDAIVDSLNRLISDPRFYAYSVRAGQDALNKELSLEVLRRRFASLMGIEESQLLPL